MGGNLPAMDPSPAPTDGSPDSPTPPSGNPDGMARHEQVLNGVERVLDDVDRALERLDEGTYGVCEACGDTIDGETLGASPTAGACRAHLPLADRT
jgi:RNA polymerase-binding transcription factor